MKQSLGTQPENTGVLHLKLANTFMSRLLGIFGSGKLAENEGLLLRPCKSVHTFFLRQALDVVFLDACGAERRCVHAMPPYRVAWAKGVCMVVELPAGYCRRHPDYLHRIHAALQLVLVQSPERNTLM